MEEGERGKRWKENKVETAKARNTKIGSRMRLNAYVLVALYERQVAKPLSICNPDRDAFAP